MKPYQGASAFALLLSLTLSAKAQVSDSSRTALDSQLGEPCIYTPSPDVDITTTQTYMRTKAAELTTQISDLKAQLSNKRRCLDVRSRIFYDAVAGDVSIDYHQHFPSDAEILANAEIPRLQTEIASERELMATKYPAEREVLNTEKAAQLAKYEAALQVYTQFTETPFYQFYVTFTGDLDAMQGEIDRRIALEVFIDPVTKDSLVDLQADLDSLTEERNEKEAIVQATNLRIEEVKELRDTAASDTQYDLYQNFVEDLYTKLEGEFSEVGIVIKLIEEAQARYDAEYFRLQVLKSTPELTFLQDSLNEEIHQMGANPAYLQAVESQLNAWTQTGLSEFELSLANEIARWVKFDSQPGQVDELTSAVQEVLLKGKIVESTPETVARMVSYLNRRSDLGQEEIQKLKAQVENSLAVNEQSQVLELYETYRPSADRFVDLLAEVIAEERAKDELSYDKAKIAATEAFEENKTAVTEAVLEEFRQEWLGAEFALQQAKAQLEEAQADVELYKDAPTIRANLIAKIDDSSISEESRAQLQAELVELQYEDGRKAQEIVQAYQTKLSEAQEAVRQAEAERDQAKVSLYWQRQIQVNKISEELLADVKTSIRAEFAAELKQASYPCDKAESKVSELRTQILNTEELIVAQERQRQEYLSTKPPVYNLGGQCVEPDLMRKINQDVNALIAAVRDEIKSNEESLLALNDQLREAEAFAFGECAAKRAVISSMDEATSIEFETLDLSEIQLEYGTWGSFDISSWTGLVETSQELPCVVSFIEVSNIASEVNLYDAVQREEFLECTAIELPDPADFDLRLGPVLDQEARLSREMTKHQKVDYDGLLDQVDLREAAHEQEIELLEAELQANESLFTTISFGTYALAERVRSCDEASIPELEKQIAQLEEQKLAEEAKFETKGTNYWQWLESDSLSKIEAIKAERETARANLDIETSDLISSADTDSLLSRVLSRRLADSVESYLTTDTEVFNQLESAGHVPSAISIAVDPESNEIISLQTLYGPAESRIDGPIHGKVSAQSQSSEISIEDSKITEIAFYGPSPHLNGLALTLESAPESPLTFGTTEGPGLEKRSLFLPTSFNDESDSYDYLFFGFESESDSTSGELTKLSVLTWDQAKFQKSRETIESADELIAKAELDQSVSLRMQRDIQVSAFYLELIENKIVVDGAPEVQPKELKVYRPEQLEIDQAKNEALEVRNAELKAKDEAKQLAQQQKVDAQVKRASEDREEFYKNAREHDDETKPANRGLILATGGGVLAILMLVACMVYKCCHIERDLSELRKTQVHIEEQIIKIEERPTEGNAEGLKIDPDESKQSNRSEKDYFVVV